MSVSPFHQPPTPYRIERPRVFLSIRLLPPSCWPGRVVRDGDVTLVAAQLGSSREALTFWMTGVLTVEELNVIRAAYSLPPVGQRLPDATLDGTVVGYVPEPLRLPRERDRDDIAG